MIGRYNIRCIPLTQGQYAIVDAWRSDELNQRKWRTDKRKNNDYYAITGNGKKTFRMHSLIKDKKEYPVLDHINHNGLDNREENLRGATPRTNAQNSKKIYSSKYPGVYYHKKRKRWYSNIRVKERKIFLGSFSNEKNAYLKYQKACKEIEEEGEDVFLGKHCVHKPSSQYPGVRFVVAQNKWRAEIQIGGYKHLGMFESEYEAHLAVEKKRRELNEQ